MKTEVENSNWMRVRSVAAGFLCVMGLPVALALADVQPTEVAAEKAPASTTEYVAPGHVANSGTDIGPGSDEAQLVMSPLDR